MGIFNTIETAFKDMVSDIVTSEDICKLLWYDVYNPLSQTIPATPTLMIYTGKDDQKEESYHRIFLTPKIPTVTENKKTIIVPRIWNIGLMGNKNETNVQYSDFVVVFDIITHVSLWTIENSGIRVFKIMEELNNLYSYKRKDYGIGKSIPVDIPYITPAEKWCGYRLGYKFTDFTIL